jgi:Flp pilus assembly protein CpaB
MNPRQRRGIILLGLSIVGAIAVFLSVSNYVSEVRAEVGPLNEALRLVEDAPAFAEVTEDMVESVPMPERWTPEAVFTSPNQLRGMVAGTDLPAGAMLQRGMLVERPQLHDGEREMAILVDAETGVAGKVGPGSYVDVYASFPATDFEPARSIIAVQNARVLDVGLPQSEVGMDGLTEDQVVPVTFALSVEDSLQLTYVDAFAAAVRLVLRAPGDVEDVPAEERVLQPLPRTVPADPSPRGDE